MPLGFSTFPFTGGLDVVSPALAVPPSRLIAGLNYEPLAEGYGRIDGYERFDGRSAPSDMSFWLLPFDTGSVAITSGVLITGLTSGATGRVVLEPVGVTGSWGAGTAAGTLILSNVAGTFLNNEQLQVTGSTRALANGIAVQDSAATEALRRTYLTAAQDYQRAAIGPVPGSGPVRGVAELKGSIYAWRNNAGGTAAKMFRATSTGWVEVPTGHVVLFDDGVTEINEGDTITGATSGATAIVRRVVRQTGDWGTDAAGYLSVSITSGTFVAESIRVSGSIVASAVDIDPITMAPNGRYRTINHNFYGAASRYAMYGASGVDYAFEFDGTYYHPIQTSMDVDTPSRVFEISQHLGLTFPGGSVQTSAIAEPMLWDVVLGAGEIGLGTEVTDVVQSAETAVILFGQQKIAVLTGRDTESFQLEELTEEAGCEPDTAQRIGQTMYLDRRGLRSLSATQAFGNFKAGTLSMLIEPYFRSKRKSGATTVLSLVSRAKSQYRLIWSDGTGLTVYMGSKTPEAIPFAFHNMQPFCSTTCEMSDGTEGIFVGAEDGYVYRLDSGTSQDGYGIKGFAMTPFNHLGSTMYEKRFFKLTVEMQAPADASIAVTAQFDYGDGNQPIAGKRDFTVQGLGDGLDFLVAGGGGDWDISTWNEFYWDSPIEGLAEAYIDGYGRNISCIIACDCHPLEDAHVLQAATIHYSGRKMKK